MFGPKPCDAGGPLRAMYELQAINDASSLTSKALLEACMMARDKTVPRRGPSDPG